MKYASIGKKPILRWPTPSRRVVFLLAGIIVATLIFAMIIQSRTSRINCTSRNCMSTTAEYRPSILEKLFCNNYHRVSNETFDVKDHWRATNVPDSVIFSAYLDDRLEILPCDDAELPAEIRIIAILPLKMDGYSLDCVYRYENNNKNGNDSATRRAPARSVRAIHENWDMEYSAFYVLCDLLPLIDYKNDVHGGVRLYLPTRIAFSREEIQEIDESSFVEIHYPKKKDETNVEEFLAICVPVFHHRYDRPLDIVAFVEYYLMLGAGHVTFYNSSISTDVDRVLEYYVSRGNVTVLPWHLPSIYVFEKTLRVEGIFAALNDCLYRSSFYRNYTYVAGVDVDEFIVPRIHNDFKELMNYLDPRSDPSARNENAAFLFRNAFFYKMYDDDPTCKEPDAPYLQIQAKTRRVKRPNMSKDRSKYIVRSKDVVELGNHQMWELRKSSIFSDFEEVTVDESVALLHHYRLCEGNLDTCLAKETIVDRTAHKFVKQLSVRVADVCEAIFGSDGCPASID